MTKTLELENLPKNPVIIVGGGLAGLSAAHQCLINGSNVVLLDKQPFFGGNSTKATSGINGSLTNTQIDLNIKDSPLNFLNDTLKSGKNQGDPKLAKVLTYQSASTIDWLEENFNLDLSLVSRLGGHSQPRTHRGKSARFPGMEITFALIEKLEFLAKEDPSRVYISSRSNVIELIKDPDNSDIIIGLKFEKLLQTYSIYGPVILATGGYAADYNNKNNDSLLAKYRPDLLHLPTTNGNHATGDGQKLVINAGGIGIDLDKVQVHPTGLVNPKNPNSKFIFLAGEALRGEGAIMIDADGKRFCDELGTRDYVSNEMTKVKGPIRLIMNSKAVKALPFHVRHYRSRKLMETFTGEELVKEIGCEKKVLQTEFDNYNKYANYKVKHPRRTIDPFGKTFFSATPFSLDDTFEVSIITRVVHFTMGGVKIDPQARVVSKETEKPMDGLYAAGELAGNIHGFNRLGGSSLLACVCFGRVSGNSATSYLLKNLSNQKPIQAPIPPNNMNSTNNMNMNKNSGFDMDMNEILLNLDPSKPNKIVVSFNNQTLAENFFSQGNFNSNSNNNNNNNSNNSTREEQPLKIDTVLTIPPQEYTMEEVAKHNSEESCWVVVKNVVLDLTSFYNLHPGGKNALINFAGQDATEAFGMLHDDNVILKYAPTTVIGRIKGKEPFLKC
ncbi:FAD-dependent oxidoreductase-like protein [Ascoidea rubescens DSM 1968]|uniref:FAD-dependent oxidoreductase-like protein n=1 Tax=Ascoidea rubescens DSM 1968 TaxID=1344418 RepID=A0A1D2VQD1_9ASCO|nr:FAD-dependent oxidoreductase-like protein [Ascoidea rubescens DSM 1968]ODV63765.1 FAD-dependent oxidoreductase-like protein [Ascoidea rubescens DSM 1968]